MIIIKTHIYESDILQRRTLLQSKTKIIDDPEVDGTIWLDINKNGINPNSNLEYDTIRLSTNRDSVLESQYFGFTLHSFTNFEKQFEKNRLKLVGDLSQISKINISSAYKVAEIKADTDKMFDAIKIVSDKLNEIVEKEIKKWKELDDDRNLFRISRSELYKR